MIFLLILVVVVVLGALLLYLFRRLNPVLDGKMASPEFFDAVLDRHMAGATFDSLCEERTELYDVEGYKALLHVNLLGRWGPDGPLLVSFRLSKPKSIRSGRERQILLKGERHLREIQSQLGTEEPFFWDEVAPTREWFSTPKSYEQSKWGFMTHLLLEVQYVARGGSRSILETTNVDWDALSPEQSEVLTRVWSFAGEFSYQREHGWRHLTEEKWVEMAGIVLEDLRNDRPVTDPEILKAIGEG